MHEVPFASWDPDGRVWTVPYRSYENLYRRWAEIEAAAIRNEPEARRQRAAQSRGTPQGQVSRARAAERRRRRYPLRADNLPHVWTTGDDPRLWRNRLYLLRW